MFRKRNLARLAALLMLQFSAMGFAQNNNNNNNNASGVVPAGTEVIVRTDNAIQATSANVGKTYSGKVQSDVMDQNGNIAIPKNSKATLGVVSQGSKTVALELRSISVNGQR